MRGTATERNHDMRSHMMTYNIVPPYSPQCIRLNLAYLSFFEWEIVETLSFSKGTFYQTIGAMESRRIFNITEVLDDKCTKFLDKQLYTYHDIVPVLPTLSSPLVPL